MAVVNWNQDFEVTDVNGAKHAVTREEFTVADTSEIATIPTQTLLQGSIVLDISTGKMHIWDGSAWVEQ